MADASTKERPRLYHALGLGVFACAIACFLASAISWDLTARIVSEILKIAGVSVDYVIPIRVMYCRLSDGTVVGFEFLIECSGLITVGVFTLIAVFTVGLLGGSLWVKSVWLLAGVSVGLLWNVSRLALVVIAAYNFGLGAFSLIHYVLAPFIDFLWIVAVWSVGMSLAKVSEGEHR